MLSTTAKLLNGKFEFAPESIEPTRPIAELMESIALRCRDKDVADLTDEERVALAIVSGCAYRVTAGHVETANPIAIQKIDGRFTVYERRT